LVDCIGLQALGVHLPECAEILLDAGADIHDRERDKRQIVHWAVQCDNLDLVRFLHKRGADINSATGSGETPLYLAVYFEYTEIMDWLLENGANVDAQLDDGTTPLHRAAEGG
jgi:ankyrin repeat protein